MAEKIEKTLVDELTHLAKAIEVGARAGDILVAVGACSNLHKLSDRHGQDIVEQTIATLPLKPRLLMSTMFNELRDQGKLDQPYDQPTDDRAASAVAE